MSISSVIPRTYLDCGWGIGIAILLLQLATTALPVGEARDWTYYYLMGGWAALFIAGGMASHFMPRHRIWKWCKTGLGAYAILALGYYFILPLINVWLAWLWLLAFAVAWAWLRQCAVKDTSTRLIWGAGMIWFLLCVFSMCGSLVYKSPWFSLAAQKNAIPYALSLIVFLAFTLPFIYAALVKPCSDNARLALKPALSFLLYGVAAYLLIVPLFRAEGLNTPSAIHHWKAYLEPASSVRDGGWLLWDVPNVYGFLQTLLLAVLPTSSTWQSLYLLNGTLVTIVGYVIFSTLFKKYHSVSGFFSRLMVALSCTLLTLPTTPDPRIYPSTGAIRFFWLYPLVGYIFSLCQYYYRRAALPRFTCLVGNLLWLAGVLWSIESAVFVTILWLPCVALIALAQALLVQKNPSPLYLAQRVLRALLMTTSLLAIAAIAIACVYYSALGHAPDLTLLTAYAKAFAFDYATIPITHLAAAPCWLCIFFMMVMVCRYYAAKAVISAQTILNITVLYAVTVALWAVTSYYIPFSEDFHLTGTLPVMVYLSAVMLLMLPQLELPALITIAYEKCMICFYSVIILGTVSHFDPGVYTRQDWLSPLWGDVTEILPDPPESLQQLVMKAGIPPQAHVLVLSGPFTRVGKDNYLTQPEGFYFKGLHLQPWLLPNSILAYDRPLPPDLYQLIARRRAERIRDRYGWIIESKDNPLENYPWIEAAVTAYYRQVFVQENNQFRIRKYEKLSASH